jgi:hypothetical protein
MIHDALWATNKGIATVFVIIITNSLASHQASADILWPLIFFQHVCLGVLVIGKGKAGPKVHIKIR